MKRTAVIMTIALLSWACSDDTEPTKSDKGAVTDTGVVADKGVAADSAAADKGAAADNGAVADTGVAADSAAASGFSATVWPTFKTSCAGGYCHGGGAGGLTMKDEAGAHAAMVGVKSTGCSSMNHVTAGDAANSYLLQKLEGKGSCFTGSQMPKGGTPLSAAQIASVKAWITAGAKK